MRSGQGALDAMPRAAQCHIVIPASRVLLSSVQLPAQNRKKFMQALSYAVEDRIMADPESVHVAAGEEQENGEMPVAIVDRAWLRQVLDSLAATASNLCTPKLKRCSRPAKQDAWALIWRGNGGFDSSDGRTSCGGSRSVSTSPAAARGRSSSSPAPPGSARRDCSKRFSGRWRRIPARPASAPERVSISMVRAKPTCPCSRRSGGSPAAPTPQRSTTGLAPRLRHRGGANALGGDDDGGVGALAAGGPRGAHAARG